MNFLLFFNSGEFDLGYFGVGYLDLCDVGIDFDSRDFTVDFDM